MDQKQADQLNAAIAEVIADNLTKNKQAPDSAAVSAAINAAVADVIASQLTGKKIWLSKTFWANVVFGAALLLQTRYGFIVGPEVQALGIAGINLLLRKITNTSIVW